MADKIDARSLEKEEITIKAYELSLVSIRTWEEVLSQESHGSTRS
jgi:hypothetical protein